MSSFEALHTTPTGTFVCSYPNDDDDAFITILITRESFSEEWHEMLEDTLEEAEELLADPDIMIFGFYNVSPDEFSPEDGEAPPQFDAVLVFKHSEGGVEGPVYAIDVDVLELERWEDAFEDCDFETLTM